MRLYLVANGLEVKLLVIKEGGVRSGEECGFRENQRVILFQAEFVRAGWRGGHEGLEGRIWPAQNSSLFVL